MSPFTSHHAGLAGQHVAVGPVGPFGTLSPSDCHPAGPAGPYVAESPVGPDGTLSPFLSDHAGLPGRHVAVGPVGPFGTLSPSDCYPAGPAGPYVPGALLAQMGHCLRLPLTMLARLAGMLLLALVGRLGLCPHLPPVL